MTRDELIRVNRDRIAEGEDPYANRNLTAGTFKMLDPRQGSKRRLRLFAYGMGANDGVTSARTLELLDQLRQFGFPVNPLVQKCGNISEVIAMIDEWAEKRHGLPYDTDGLVVKVNDLAQRERLGIKSKSPRGSLPTSSPPSRRDKSRAIDVQVGKTGKLTPVARLDPVKLAGTTVSNATLHNAQEILRKDIRVGDMVLVEKAGEIIPYVVRSEPSATTGTEKVFHFPSHCPVCNAAVEPDEDKVFYYCTSPTCPAQLKERLRWFATRGAMDVEGLGEAVVEQLVDAGLVKTIPDLYRLKLEQIVDLKLTGEKATRKLGRKTARA